MIIENAEKGEFNLAQASEKHWITLAPGFFWSKLAGEEKKNILQKLESNVDRIDHFYHVLENSENTRLELESNLILSFYRRNDFPILWYAARLLLKKNNEIIWLGEVFVRG